MEEAGLHNHIDGLKKHMYSEVLSDAARLQSDIDPVTTSLKSESTLDNAGEDIISCTEDLPKEKVSMYLSVSHKL